MIPSRHHSPRTQMTERDFCAWLGRAACGDQLEYHRGFLALEVTAFDYGPDRAELRRLASRAMWAHQCGLVHLVQRRVGPGCFRYLAIRRPCPPRRARIELAFEPALPEAA